MRLIMANLMNHKSLNSNHWLSKRRNICACNIMKLNKIAILIGRQLLLYMHKCHNVSTTSDWNLMIFGLLDLP